MIVQASLIKERPITWIWKGRIPAGVITILEGDPGTAKSQLSVMLASHITTGRKWPDGEFCPEGAAIIANAEDPEEEVIIPRLRAAEADLTKAFVVTPETKTYHLFTIPDNVPALEAEISRMNVKLLVFDPLEAFLSPSVDNYRNHHIRRGLKSLELMAKRIGCAVVIVRHLTKDAGKAAIYRGSGSIGIIGAARSGLSVGHDPTDPSRCIVVPTKANWAKMKPGLAYKIEDHSYLKDEQLIETSRIVWDGEVNIKADDLLTVVEGTPTSERAGGDVADFIRSELASGPRPSKEVLAQATKRGFARKAVFAAAKFMGLVIYKETILGTGEWVWELPDQDARSEAARWGQEESLDQVLAEAFPEYGDNHPATLLPAASPPIATQVKE